MTSAHALLDNHCPLPLDEPFTLGGAAALGVSRRVLRALVARGSVRRVCQGVYAAVQAPDTIDFRAAALRLVVAPSAVVTDRTAAWLHGIDLLPRTSLSVMPPLSFFDRPGYRARRPGVVSGERMLSSRDIEVIHGVVVTTPLRTACDLGRLLYRFDALAALDQYLRLGVNHDELLIEIQRFKGYRGVIQLRVLTPIADARAESVAESWLRLFWLDAGLPAPEPQWWEHDDRGVPRYRLDLALPEARFGAEYNGEEFHSSPEDVEADDERLSWLRRERGWHIEVFVKDDVFGFRADPVPRLQQGLVIARGRLPGPGR
jgi:hypothetical protein